MSGDTIPNQRPVSGDSIPNRGGLGHVPRPSVRGHDSDLRQIGSCPPTGSRSLRQRIANFELGERAIVRLLLLAGAISGGAFLHGGYPFFGDVWPHLVRLQIAYEAFRAGHLPGWSFFFYNGYPLLRFYSPLFFYVGALFCFLTSGNAFTAAKVVLFLLHIGSGFAFYYLARRLVRGHDPESDDRFGSCPQNAVAFLAAFAYLFSYWHLVFVIGFGQYPAGMIFVLMPLALLLFDRLLERPGLSRAIWAGLGFALLPLTHVFYAYFWVPFVLLWLLRKEGRTIRTCRTGLPPGDTIPNQMTDSGHVPRPGHVPWGWTLVSVVVAILVSAFFIIPFFIEGPRYRMPSPLLNSSAPSALTLLGLSREMSGYSGSYIGLGIIVLAICGILRLIQNRCLLRSPLFWGLVLSLALAFSGYLPILNRIPLIGELPAERFLVFSLFFAALLAGLGYLYLREKLAVNWLWLPVVVVLFMDLAPRLTNNVYRSGDEFLGSRAFVYDRLFDRQDGRLLDLPIQGRDPSRRFTRLPANGYLFAGLPSVLGPPYHQFAPRSMLYGYAWVNDIGQDFLDSTQQAMSDRTLQELRLLDGRYVLTLPTHKESESKTTYVFLKRGLVWNDTLLRQAIAQQAIADAHPDSSVDVPDPFVIGTFEEVSPVVVSRHATAREPLTGARGESLDVMATYYVAPDWRELPSDMSLDPLSGVAQRIFTLGLNDSTKLPRDTIPSLSVDTIPNRSGLGHVPRRDSGHVPGSTLTCRFEGIRQEQELVELRFSVSADCYARLAYSYYPDLRVWDNDRPTKTWETYDHFLLIRLGAGRHVVRIEPTTSPLRRLMDRISAGALVLCLIGLIALPLAGRRRQKA